jgi:hypothetical protein
MLPPNVNALSASGGLETCLRITIVPLVGGCTQ